MTARVEGGEALVVRHRQARHLPPGSSRGMAEFCAREGASVCAFGPRQMAGLTLRGSWLTAKARVALRKQHGRGALAHFVTIESALRLPSTAA